MTATGICDWGLDGGMPCSARTGWWSKSTGWRCEPHRPAPPSPGPRTPNRKERRAARSRARRHV